MSNDKSEATYHGHLDDAVNPDTIPLKVGPGQVIGPDGIIPVQGMAVETPREPGKYALELDPGTNHHRWIKIAEVTVPPENKLAVQIGKFLGATVCVTVVVAGLLIGIRALLAWLWGI